MAAQRGWTGVVEALCAAGAPVDAPRVQDDATPLFIAAEFGHLQVVKHLYEARAQPDRPRHDGRTPLAIAAMKGNSGVAEFLADVGRAIPQKRCSAPEREEVL